MEAICIPLDKGGWLMERRGMSVRVFALEFEFENWKVILTNTYIAVPSIFLI